MRERLVVVVFGVAAAAIAFFACLGITEIDLP